MEKTSLYFLNETFNFLTMKVANPFFFLFYNESS